MYHRRVSIDSCFGEVPLKDFELPGSEPSEHEEQVARQLAEDEHTETIDLANLFSMNVTTSGSFDVRGDIWATTFGKLIQALPVSAMLVDPSCKIIVANQACRRIHSDHEKIVGRSFSDLYPDPAASSKAESIVIKVFETRKPRRFEGALRIGSRQIWGRTTFRSIRITTQRYVLALVEDLTVERKHLRLSQKYQEELQKRVEERTAQLEAMAERLKAEIVEKNKAHELLLQTERLKAAGELASGTAHNFNNLLQIIIGGIDLAITKIDSGDIAEVRECLEPILESAEFGTETVRRLQSFASIRESAESQETAVFDLGEVIRQSVQLTKPWWKTNPEKQAKQISLIMSLGDQCFIQGDGSMRSLR